MLKDDAAVEQVGDPTAENWLFQGDTGMAPLNWPAMVLGLALAAQEVVQLGEGGVVRDDADRPQRADDPSARIRAI